MVNEHRIREEVEKTLNAFEEDEVLEENPFLLTRIEAAAGRRVGAPRFLAGVNLRYVGMLLLLLMNLITALVYGLRADGDLDAQLVSQLKADFQMDQSQTNF